MSVIAIDPSTTATGIAIGNGKISHVEAIKPKGKIYAKRVERMLERLDELFEEWQTKESPIVDAIIEIPSGKTHGRLQHKNIQGLPAYGFAVGAIWLWARANLQDVHTVFDNDWTRGKPKATRKPLAGHLFEQYCFMNDPGLDICDAICLWEWYRVLKMVEQRG